MESRNTGGSAFPVAHRGTGDNFETLYDGMTLRDWLAGQALANERISDAEGGGWAQKNAGYCYQQSDAMLLERSR